MKTLMRKEAKALYETIYGGFVKCPILQNEAPGCRQAANHALWVLRGCWTRLKALQPEVFEE